MESKTFKFPKLVDLFLLRADYSKDTQDLKTDLTTNFHSWSSLIKSVTDDPLRELLLFEDIISKLKLIPPQTPFDF